MAMLQSSTRAIIRDRGYAKKIIFQLWDNVRWRFYKFIFSNLTLSKITSIYLSEKIYFEYFFTIKGFSTSHRKNVTGGSLTKSWLKNVSIISRFLFLCHWYSQLFWQNVIKANCNKINTFQKQTHFRNIHFLGLKKWQGLRDRGYNNGLHV